MLYTNIQRANSNSDDWKLSYMVIISFALNTSEDGSPCLVSRQNNL